MQMPDFSAACWRKSSYSDHNGACVEVAFASLAIGVRDSKSTDAGHLALVQAQWHAFVDAVKNDNLGS